MQTWVKVKVKMHNSWADCVTMGVRRGGMIAVRFRSEYGASMWVKDSDEVVKYV